MELTTIQEISIGYKPVVKLSERPVITNSQDAFDIFMTVWNPGTVYLLEEFKVILLNRANKCIGVHTISQGGMNGTVIDIRLIFATALKACATSIILGHNHPSGNLNYSEADKTITKKISEAGKIMEIPVLDHLIITPDTYLSFNDKEII